MKKITLLLTAALFTTAAFSQMDFNYGIKAGANFSTLTNKATNGSISSGTSYKVGLRAGAFAELGVASGMALEANVLYNQMGGAVNFDISGTVEKVNFNLDYITIPVNFKYSIPNVVGFSAFIGPQMSILMNAKPGKDIGLTSSEFKNSFQSFDFAANLGVEYQLPMGIRFSALYQYSFLNSLKQKEDNGTPNVVFAISVNSGAIFTLGYAFGGKKK